MVTRGKLSKSDASRNLDEGVKEPGQPDVARHGTESEWTRAV